MDMQRTEIMPRRSWWRWIFWTAGAVVVAAAPPGPHARAAIDDEPKPEQLKQMYQDTLDQLKKSQERKTQLAAENEQLKARVAELEKQLQATQAKYAELQKQADGYAEKTFFLRSHYAAWQEFLRRYPRLQIRWKLYLEDDALTPRQDGIPFVDPDWPWSAQS
jgi:septal ring factor EnvC (AmiA/AmiB activator)